MGIISTIRKRISDNIEEMKSANVIPDSGRAKSAFKQIHVKPSEKNIREAEMRQRAEFLQKRSRILRQPIETPKRKRLKSIDEVMKDDDFMPENPIIAESPFKRNFLNKKNPFGL